MNSGPRFPVQLSTDQHEANRCPDEDNPADNIEGKQTADQVSENRKHSHRQRDTEQETLAPIAVSEMKKVEAVADEKPRSQKEWKESEHCQRALHYILNCVLADRQICPILLWRLDPLYYKGK